ncbi:DUF2510 domain-containing protein [Streptomyces sp. NPDC005151]
MRDDRPGRRPRTPQAARPEPPLTAELQSGGTSDGTPPGRYPDAAAPGTDRWWDGTAWTARTPPHRSSRSRPRT